MGGFAGMFTGTNPTLDKMTQQSQQVANYGTGLGEKSLTGASNFYNTLLGGDQAAMAKLLAPQTQAMQEQGQQQKQTAAQFGNRSGGANAGMQMLDDQTRAQITNLIAQLTGNAAAGATGLGENVLGQGMAANQQAAQEAQMQQQNLMNSIGGGLVQGLGSNLGTMITGGLGKIPGLSAVI